MSFTGLLNNTVTVKRPTAGAGIQRTYQQVATGVPCMVQPLSEVAEAQTGSAFGKSLRAFFDVDADVKEGDQVIEQTGMKLYVRGIKKYTYGNFPHIEALLGEDKRP
jgi:hypothetical protein